MEQTKHCCSGEKCAHPDGPNLPLSEFYKNAGTYDGLQAACKTCKRLYLKAYRSTPEFRERDNAQHRSLEYRAWRRTYRSRPEIAERIKTSRHTPEFRKYNAACSRARRQTPEGKARERALRQRPDHQVRAKAYRKAYAQTSTGKLVNKVKTHNRLARLRNLPARFTKEDWLQALGHFKNRCAVCGREAGYSQDLFGEYTLAADHWIPLSNPECPGSVPTNIVPLCHGADGCNNSKSSSEPHAWLISRFGPHKAAKIERRIEAFFASLETNK